MPESEPYSIDYWLERLSAKEITNAIFKTGDQEKINAVLGFLGGSEIRVGSPETPGDKVGELLIEETV